MSFDVQNRIEEDINVRRYLRENSYWYKRLNRDNRSIYILINDMKEKYGLTISDKINKTIDNINMLQGFLDVLK